MANVTLRESWTRWGGSADQIIAITEQSLSTIKAVSKGKQPTLYCLLTTPPDDESRSVSVDQFRTGLQNITQLKKIEIVVSDEDSGLVANITLSSEPPAARLEVQGDNQVEVQGVRSELRHALDVGKRWPKSTYTTVAIGMVIGLLIGVAFSIGIDYVPFGWLPNNLLGSIIASLLGGITYLALLIAAIAFMRWALPTLELIPAGGKSRLVRYKGLISAGALFLLGAVLTAFIGSLFD